MSSLSPNAVLYDSSGLPMPLQNATSIPSNTSGLLIMGSDGTNSRYIATDTSGRQIVVGAGVAGTPTGGVLTIQGASGMTALIVNNATAGNLLANVGGLASAGSASSGNPLWIAGNVTTSAPSYANNTINALSLTLGGLLRVDGVYPINTTTPTSDAVFVAGAVTTSAPSYTTGQMSALSLTTVGALRVDGSATTQPISGTVTANQGTANTTANAWPTKVTDGTNTAAVKAASTAAVATDPALVVTMSPNSSTPMMTDRQVTGTLTNVNDTVVISTQGSVGIGLQVSGTWSGTINFQASMDNGATWFNASGLLIASGGTLSNTANSTNVNGQWKLTSAGLTNIRTLFSIATSGTANIMMDAGPGLPFTYVSQGSPGSIANSWYARLSDGSNGPVAVKAASTAAAAADLSLVVALSPNSPASGTATTSAPTYTTGTVNPLSLNTTGDLRVTGKVTDGTNIAAVKAASTAATTTDPALVVSISPNIGTIGKLPVSLTEIEDVFGQAITVQRLSQIQVPFYMELPSTLLTVTTSGTATSSQGTGVGIFSTGTGTTAEVTGVSFSTVFYSPHCEIYAAVTASFTTPTSSASYQRIGIYNSVDGFSFGYNGTTFGIWARFNSVDTFIAQASWSTDVLSGAVGSKFTNNGSPVALIQTNINLYRIRYGWLGIAPTVFEVLSPDGNFITVHIDRFPNSQTTVSLTNPNLPLTVDVNKSAADATNLSITSGCWVAGTTSAITPNFNGISTISALNGTVLIPTIGLASLGFNITGTWVGVISFQFSTDGINWINDSVLNDLTGMFVGSTSVNTNFETNVAACKQYRIIATAWTSGSAIVSYSVNSGGPSVITTQTLITDGLNDGPAAVKPASTAALTTDPALVVSVSPNTSISSVTKGIDSLGNILPITALLKNGSNHLNVIDQFANNKLDDIAIGVNDISTGINGLTGIFGNQLSVNIANQFSSSSPQYGTSNQTVTITLASLASAAARSSTVVDNTFILYEDVYLFFKITTAATGVSATGYVNIYGYGSVDGGTTYPEGITGADAGVTLTAPPNLFLLAQINANTTSATKTLGPVSFCRMYGVDRLPAKWGVVVVNNTGATFGTTASGFAITYQGINGQLS